MKKLLLSLSIVAFAFSQSMVMAAGKEKKAEVAVESEDSDQEETMGTKVGKKIDAAGKKLNKVADKAKKGGKKVVEKVGEGVGKVKEGAKSVVGKIDYLRRDSMGELRPEEKAAKSKEEAERSKKKIDEKELKKFEKKMEGSSEDFEKLRDRTMRAAEKFEKLHKGTKDKKIGSVEDVSLNIALENAIRSYDYLMLPLSTMFDMYKAAKKSNTLDEFRQQAILAQYAAYRWRRSFAMAIVNLAKAFNEANGMELFNKESVLAELSVFREKLVNGDDKNAIGKDIMENYRALVRLANVTKDVGTQEFLEGVKPAFELASIAYTDVIQAMEEFVTDKINGEENDGQKLLKAISEDNKFGYSIEEIQQMVASKVESSESVDKDEEKASKSESDESADKDEEKTDKDDDEEE